MAIAYNNVFSAIERKSTPDLLACFQGLGANEVVELGTFIGPKRLAAVDALSVGAVERGAAVRTPPAFSYSPATLPLKELITETYYRAFGDCRMCIDRKLDPAAIGHVVASGIADVARRRKAKLIVTMPDDPTGTIPKAPDAVPPALSEADFQASATRNTVSVAAIKAVSKVESGGRSGFDSRGRPKIAFEGHYFRRLTGRIFDKTHPHLSHVYYTPSASPYINWDQYERLMEAILLDEEAALKSASWGKFQVMGEFHDGWPDVRSFVAAMYVSEANHLKSFEAHAGPGGMAELRRKDWLGFARRYNGKNQVGYDGRIAGAYAAAGGR